MAAMNLSAIRSYVYSFLDIDSNDLPQAVLDVLIGQAWDRIIRSERRWSFYEQTGTFVTAAGQQEYPLETLTGTPTASYPWRDVVDISDPIWGPMRPLAHVSARRKFTRSNVSNRPQSFSFHRNSVWLWPIPNSVKTYTVDGYRKPIDWIAANGAPDAPDEFHPLVAQHALSLAYGQQDDPSGAEQTMARFDTAFAQVRQEYVDDTTAGPLILNGGEGLSEWLPSRFNDRSDFFG